MSTTVSEIRREMLERLSSSVGAREASAMAGVILEDVLGVSPVEAAINPGREITDSSETRIRGIVDRVVAGEPLQYVIGTTVFHGLRLNVRPGVLIPRPETSQLVDIVCDAVGDRPDLRVLDVCTGSGAIAAALGRSLRFPEITATDLSDDALAVARGNFDSLGLKVDLGKSDVLSDGIPSGPFDVIVSNPPYVDESERPDIDPRVVNYEPSMALFVPDSDPLVFYRHIATGAIDALVAGGQLFFEINPRHATDVRKLLTGLGFDNVAILRDFTGTNRFAIATKTA